jgi:hypothetical protein
VDETVSNDRGAHERNAANPRIGSGMQQARDSMDPEQLYAQARCERGPGRRKPSRWCETTRTERDRRSEIRRPNREQQCSWRSGRPRGCRWRGEELPTEAPKTDRCDAAMQRDGTAAERPSGPRCAGISDGPPGIRGQKQIYGNSGSMERGPVAQANGSPSNPAAEAIRKDGPATGPAISSDERMRSRSSSEEPRANRTRRRRIRDERTNRRPPR